MRQLMTWAVVLVLGTGGVTSVQAAYDAGVDNRPVAEDSFFDRLGDNLATLFKSGEEKEAIKAERRADRIAKRTGNRIEDNLENAGDKMEDAGDKAQDRAKDAADKVDDKFGG